MSKASTVELMVGFGGFLSGRKRKIELVLMQHFGWWVSTRFTVCA